MFWILLIVAVLIGIAILYIDLEENPYDEHE